MHPDCPLAAGKKKGRATPWHPPKSRLLIAVSDDGATPNYDQSGGPSNLDAPLHQPPGLRAWAEGDPAEHHQIDVHARLLTGAWTPTQCCHQMQHWGKSVHVHIKDGDRPFVTRGRRRRVPACMPRARRSQPVVPAKHGWHVVGPHYNLQCSPQYCTTQLYKEYRGAIII